jgi:hypothetical protein
MLGAEDVGVVVSDISTSEVVSLFGLHSQHRLYAHELPILLCQDCLGPGYPRPGDDNAIVHGQAGDTGQGRSLHSHLKRSQYRSHKDSDKRQRQAIAAFAKRSGHELVDELGVLTTSRRVQFRSHARVYRQQRRSYHHCRDRKPLRTRPNGQEVGFTKLQALGVKLVAADSPQSFLDDTPTSKLIRQILGAVSEFDKAMVVAKLKSFVRCLTNWGG